MPTCFLLEGLKETDGIMVFGTIDGPDYKTYKVGNECDDLDPHLQLRVMQAILPSKIEKITHVMPCFYSMSHDDEFIFEKKGNTVYGFGCNGRGFKHMTYHGKRVYHLLSGNQAEADKYKKKQGSGVFSASVGVLKPNSP